LKAPTQNYQASDLKSFLQILIPSSDDKTLEHYCQKYARAKQSKDILEKINHLIQECIQHRNNLPVWQRLLTIYQDQISPLLQ